MDDALGFRLDATYPQYLLLRYGAALAPAELSSLPEPPAEFLQLSLAEQITELSRQLDEHGLSDAGSRVLMDWRDNVMRFALGEDPDSLLSTLSTAVEHAARGELAPELAPLLARVRWLPDGTVDIPDLPSFAAWSLSEILHKGPVEVATCPSCERPWLVERGARFCKRPAPGARVPCRALEAQRRYLSEHRDYHRQRRRLYDRMKRGTLAQNDYRAWLTKNRPGRLGETWVTWEEWSAGKQLKSTKRKEE